jgi:sorbitol/mannitol transport system permease protein
MTGSVTSTRVMEQKRRVQRLPAMLLLLPALIYLIVTTQVPFLMTIYYSLFRWNLTIPGNRPFVGVNNYLNLFTDPLAFPALVNTFVLVFSVIIVTLVLGFALAMLLHRRFRGQGFLRTLLISPFFIMPVVTAVIWKNMLLHPVFGLVSDLVRSFGILEIDWLERFPMASIVTIVSWEWTPFAMLILLTGLQSLPSDQIEAASIDGAGPWTMFRFIVLPHMRRAIEVTVLLETIFILQIFGEIFVTTSGGPGTATTNLPFFLYQKAFQEYNIGVASAAGVLAVVVANIMASFVLRLIGGNIRPAGGAA